MTDVAAGGEEQQPRQFSPPLESGDLYRVHLRVDGEVVPIKAFIHDMIGGAVCGLVSGLRGIEDPGEVVIEVRKG